MKHRSVIVCAAAIVVPAAGWCLAEPARDLVLSIFEDGRVLVGADLFGAGILAVAQENGGFESAGVHATLFDTKDDASAAGHLESGDIQVAAIGATRLAAAAYDLGTRLVVLAALGERRDFAVLARRSRGIAAPAELARRTLSFPPDLTHRVLAHKFLGGHGLGGGAVRMEAVDEDLLVDRFLVGRLDAVLVSGVLLVAVLRSGDADVVRLESASEPGEPLFLVSTGDFVREHAESCRRLLQALALAEERANLDRDAAGRAWARALDVAAGDGAALVAGAVFAVGPAEPFTAALDASAAWLRRTDTRFHGLEPPAFPRLFRPACLRAALPARAGIRTHPVR